jgi:hypothetical protein
VGTVGLLATVSGDTTVAAISESTGSTLTEAASSGGVGVSSTASLSETVGSGGLVSSSPSSSGLSSGVVAGSGIRASGVSLLLGGSSVVALGTLSTSLAGPLVAEASGGGITE